jgi:FkbM family methyltransferase
LGSITALFLRELARLIDKTFKNVTFSRANAVRFQNVRNFLLQSLTRVRWEKLDLSRVPVVFEKQSGKFFRICVINRAAGYQKGFKRKGDELASSYGLDMVPLRTGDLIVDVGANVGDLLLYLDEISKVVVVDYLGIEPGTGEFACLESNLKIPEGDVRQIAIGSSCGQQKFFYSPEGADSSLFKPLEASDEYIVRVQTLDCLLTQEKYSARRIRFLKLECEGGELEALQGAKNSLHRVDYIGADLGFEKGELQESPAPQVIHFLLANGFSVEYFTYPSIIRILFRNNAMTEKLNAPNGSLTS